VIIPERRMQRGEVERRGHAQRSGERTAPLRLGEARRVAMQVGSAPGEATPLIGHRDAVLRDDAQQQCCRRAGAAADARALRPG
jgi:hypothetical protein